MTAARIPYEMPQRASAPPALEAGDHLTRDEFERRYRAMRKLKKAELVEGVVYMGSPVSASHSDPHANLTAWMAIYASQTLGVRCGDNGSVRLDQLNEPQPDAHLRIESKRGGQTSIAEDDFVSGAPELVAEVAVSSTSYDLHSKLQVYRRHSVREYIVWRVADQAIDWFFLNEGRFDPLPRADGLFKSRVFPGLWLDDAAMLAGDLAKVLAVLQQGLATVEHAAFVKRLEEAASKK